MKEIQKDVSAEIEIIARNSDFAGCLYDIEKIPTKVILDGLKRSMSRGNSLSDELDLSSVLGDTRAYLYSPGLGLSLIHI